MIRSVSASRVLLFLQGVASPFFEDFSLAVRKLGYVTYRINFCGGDLNLTKTNEYIVFQGKVSALKAFYNTVFQQYSITDIILFGDNRAIHIPAIALASQLNIEIYVFEEGYLRPNFVTLEKKGVNANSLLFENIRNFKGQIMPDTIETQKADYKLRIRAYYDLKYRFFNLIYLWKFRHYQSHRPYNGFVEYIGWIKRFIKLPYFHNKALILQSDLKTTQQRFFIFPLQLNSDVQIQVHSKFLNVKESIKEVIVSFSKYANKAHALVIKNHPLDTGIINYQKYTQKLAQTYQLNDRIHFIDGGHLSDLIKEAEGMVLINSTTGMQALALQCPVCVLGKAIYDIKRLTFQGALDLFWQNPMKPDFIFFNQFSQYLIQQSQINGNFYSKRGIELVIKNSLLRLQL